MHKKIKSVLPDAATIRSPGASGSRKNGSSGDGPDGILDKLSVGVGVIEQPNADALVLTYANPALRKILEHPETEDLPARLDDISALAFETDFLDAVEQCIKSSDARTFFWHIKDTDEDRVFSGEVTLFNPADQSMGTAPAPVKLLFSLIDQTEERVRQQTLIHEALHDPLTSLPNHGYFRIKVSAAMDGDIKAGNTAVFIFNIDRFSVINQSLGYHAGDVLLKEIARRIETAMPDDAVLARFNSDEFALLFHHVEDEANARQLAHDFHCQLSAPFRIDNQEIHVTAAIGVAINSPRIQNSEDLIRCASIATHRAKAEGCNRVVVYHHDLSNRTRSLFTLERDLRIAIEQETLELHYQPICHLGNGALIGFEALARWNHPERGPISPVEFIAVAESSGQIIPLGRWAINRACQQLAEWDRIGGQASTLTVNVNVSGIQLAEPDFPETVRNALFLSGLPGDRLHLEITESTIMTNAELVTDSLLDLKALGIGIAIDDFGTGYSSLSYLHRFPIDTLKIDRSFVMRLSDNAEDSKIVNIMTMLAQNLGMKAVAEGIETRDQLERLEQLGCHQGQGYYFSRPLTTDKATDLIKNGATLPLMHKNQ